MPLPFVPFLGRQCGAFIHGCYDGFITAQQASSSQVPYTDQVPISASAAGKKAINEALRTGDPDKVITAIDKVCSDENLNKMGCVSAMYYCSRAVLAGASELIRGACTNLLV